MNCDNATFEEWWAELCELAESEGGVATNEWEWRSDYHAGKTPRQAWNDL